MSERESPLLAEVRLAIGLRGDILPARINTGVFRPLHEKPGTKKRVIRSAPNGTPDLLIWQRRVVDTIRIINPDSFTPYEKRETLTYAQGIFVETKAAKGKQREAQENFQAAAEKVGGIYILARSVDDVLRVLGRDATVSS